ncbi:MAG: hypothetical protein Q9227_002637 [Pyrenula ochraceoflavens]
MSAERKYNAGWVGSNVDLEQPSPPREQPQDRIAFRPFVGRLGGNQDFAVSQKDPDAKEILEKTPDAGYFFTWKDSFDLRGFQNLDLYKMAAIEAWGMTNTTGLTPVLTKLSTGALVPALIGGVTNAIFLALFIFSAGTVSGGHLNPMITVAVFLTRLATFPRTVIYVIAQSIGAIIGAFLIRAALGTKLFALAGCTWDSQTTTQGEAFAMEATTAMTLLFLVFGVGLDPRQKEVFGPALSPILDRLRLYKDSKMTNGVVSPSHVGAS